MRETTHAAPSTTNQNSTTTLAHACKSPLFTAINIYMQGFLYAFPTPNPLLASSPALINCLSSNCKARQPLHMGRPRTSCPNQSPVQRQKHIATIIIVQRVPGSSASKLWNRSSSICLSLASSSSSSPSETEQGTYMHDALIHLLGLLEGTRELYIELKHLKAYGATNVSWERAGVPFHFFQLLATAQHSVDGDE